MTEHDLTRGCHRPVQDDAPPRDAAGDDPAWKTGERGLGAGGCAQDQPESYGSGPPGGGGSQWGGQQQRHARRRRGTDDGLQHGIALSGTQHLIDGWDERVDVVEAQQIAAQTPTGRKAPQPDQAPWVLRSDNGPHRGMLQKPPHA